MPIPLLTRFDLIFVVRDIPAKEKDEKIARHIIDLHTPQGTDKRSVIDADLLTKYLSFAKKLSPNLTKEAEEKILEYYLIQNWKIFYEVEELKRILSNIFL